MPGRKEMSYNEPKYGEETTRIIKEKKKKAARPWRWKGSCKREKGQIKGPVRGGSPLSPAARIKLGGEESIQTSRQPWSEKNKPKNGGGRKREIGKVE